MCGYRARRMIINMSEENDYGHRLRKKIDKTNEENMMMDTKKQ